MCIPDYQITHYNKSRYQRIIEGLRSRASLSMLQAAATKLKTNCKDFQATTNRAYLSCKKLKGHGNLREVEFQIPTIIESRRARTKIFFYTPIYKIYKIKQINNLTPYEKAGEHERVTFINDTNQLNQQTDLCVVHCLVDETHSSKMVNKIFFLLL